MAEAQGKEASGAGLDVLNLVEVVSPGELGRVPGTERPRGSILQPSGGCSLRFWERC